MAAVFGHHCGVQEWEEADLAWQLAELVVERLSADQRSMIFTELGAGESYAVIVKLLETSVHARVSMPIEVAARLDEWFQSYRGSRDEPRLRALLGRIN